MHGTFWVSWQFIPFWLGVRFTTTLLYRCKRVVSIGTGSQIVISLLALFKSKQKVYLNFVLNHVVKMFNNCILPMQERWCVIGLLNRKYTLHGLSYFKAGEDLIFFYTQFLFRCLMLTISMLMFVSMKIR